MAFLSPFIIPVFTPHLGCPHVCLFCNQHAITGTRLEPERISSIIEAGLRSPKRKTRPVQVAFYGGNFASLPEPVQNELLAPCRKYLDAGQLQSVRVSTRPDSLNLLRISALQAMGVDTVELGVQSLDSTVLRLNRRGHGIRSVEKTVGELRRAGMCVGVQLMVGLYGDSREKSLATAHKAVSLHPDLARLYPTLVLKNSGLARLYEEGRYRPLSVPEAVEQCRDMADVLEQGGVRIIRIGLQDTPGFRAGGDVLAGPHHPALGQLVRASQWKARAEACLRAYPGCQGGLFRVHTRQISNFRGQRNQNVEELERTWSLRLRVVADPSLDEREVRFEPD